MAPSILGGYDEQAMHSLCFSKKDTSANAKGSLPSIFYHSPQVYELERRAIFSKRWFLVSHTARYKNVGDFVQYEMAGFNFVVLRNRSNIIVGFHNICRHRAFPVVQKPSGNASILACKYHGWSYGLDGRLAKAPSFTNKSSSEFDPSLLHLFPVHVHVDKNGFVYVNLDAKKQPDISWESQYGRMDEQEGLVNSGINWDSVEYDFTWNCDGKFNWKLMQENYNECYHCSTSHPGIARTVNLETYFVEVPSDSMYISHFSEPKPTISSQFDKKRFTGRSATHVFPVGHVSPNPGTGMMYLMRTVPTGPTTSRQEYDVYKLHTPQATAENHAGMVEFYQKVENEDIFLCNSVQTNLQRGVFLSGPLHSFREEGVLAFHRMVKGILLDHVEQEKEAGGKIWPAEAKRDEYSAADKECEHILSCAAAKAPELEW